MNIERTPKEDLFDSQLHSQNMFDSFLPIVEKTFARYTAQASDVMICANRLWDRICFLVFKSLATTEVEDGKERYKNQNSQKDLFGTTRFTRLRLWTQGNTKDNIDGFCNNPHVDRDACIQTFQQLAKGLIEMFRSDNSFNQTDVKYLTHLLAMGHGKFQTPTVCGYDIVRTDTKDSRDVHACFALLGIRVSVKLCHCYHYFFPTTLTHCTPWPITFIDSNILTTYNHGEINIVGWGGGNSRKRREFYNRHGGLQVNRLTQENFINWLATLPQNLQIIARRQGLLNP